MPLRLILYPVFFGSTLKRYFIKDIYNVMSFFSFVNIFMKTKSMFFPASSFR
ncbi:hypothetical protein HMPREF1548_03290 [Clostridium sp. KLE 1755]|nr:hypothetical protein HMPREF1548_03290 [Clostridium sp. KLE 1755]